MHAREGGVDRAARQPRLPPGSGSLGQARLTMSRRYIAHLEPGERIEDQVFLIKQKDLRTTTNGGLYIHAVLTDRTGQIPSRMWQASQKVFEFMPQGGFMRFTGRCENYKGNLQFIIDGLREAEAGSFDVADFLPVTPHDIDKMFQRVCQIMRRELKHPDLRELAEEFLSDEEMMTRFRRAPAAVQLHHAYVGGLLEHTLSLLEVGLKVIPLYPRLSLDLVLIGLFLHDMGKTTELGYDTHFHYSDEGQLLGHVPIAVAWIDERIRRIETRRARPFPDDLRWALQHIIVSHHGQYEFGAVKLPAMPEAVAVHYLDNLDAKIHIFLSEIENDRDPEDHWTNYQPSLGTRIFKVDPMGTRPAKGAKSGASGPPS